MLIIKKYSNRRLYDSATSRYITLEELAERIRQGHDVRVQDASTDADLTQATLAQIILEGRGAAHFLSVPVLVQLVRLQDDALAEFFGRYLAFALDAWLKTRQPITAVAQWNPWLGQALQHVGRVVPGWPFVGGPTREPAAGVGEWTRPYGQAPVHSQAPMQQGPWDASPATAPAADAARSAAEEARAAAAMRHAYDQSVEAQHTWQQGVSATGEPVGFTVNPHYDSAYAAHAAPTSSAGYAGQQAASNDDVALLRQELAEMRAAFAANAPKRGRPAKKKT